VIITEILLKNQTRAELYFIPANILKLLTFKEVMAWSKSDLHGWEHIRDLSTELS
jgi:hypothetical protein